MVMNDVPTWTYILDALGAFGLVVGGYVASKSVYSRENSKDAALLIDTQRKRIDSLLEELKDIRRDRDGLHAQMNEIQGQLAVYKDLQLVKPDLITQLGETQNAILKILEKKV
jgi:hypothetical protein